MDIYSTTAMKTVLTALRKQSPRWLLDTFFPGMQLSDSEDICFDVEVADEEVAPFVSPTAAGVLGADTGFETLSFRPAYVKPKDPIKQNAPLRRMLGEQLGGSMSASQREAALLGEKLRQHADRILRRKLLMGAEVLDTGKCVVTGERYPTVIVDFRRDAELTKALAGAARWGETGVSPYDDVTNWIELVGEKSGAAVSHVVMTGDAWKLFEADAKLKEVLDRTLGQTTAIALGMAAGLPGSPVWKGRIGLVDFYVWNDTYKEDGVKKTVLPPYTVLMAAVAAAEGTQAHGAILDPKAGYQSLEMFAKSWLEEDPGQRVLLTQSAPLVYPRRPNATFRARVR